MSEVFSSVSSLLAWIKRYPGFSAGIGAVAVVYNAMLAAGVLALVLAVWPTAGQGERGGSASRSSSRGKQGITLKEYLAKKPFEPALVRAQVQLSQADVGWVGQGCTMDSFVIKDDADSQEVFGFNQLRDSHDGRRLYYLLGNGSTRTMTLKLDPKAMEGFAGIASEN